MSGVRSENCDKHYDHDNEIADKRNRPSDTVAGFYFFVGGIFEWVMPYIAHDHGRQPSNGDAAYRAQNVPP